MRQALNNLNADLVKEHPDYVCRVVSVEGDVGRGHLSRFQELESETPVIITTSQLLSTGVDIPMCKNVVLARTVGSMTEFKQIIGRGTRVRDDYGKLFFNIIDYTGSATRQFADPSFDGEPDLITVEEMDEAGRTIEDSTRTIQELVEIEAEPEPEPGGTTVSDDSGEYRRKYYVDGGSVEIAAHLVYELDPNGKQMRVVKFTDYTAEAVRGMYTSAAELRSKWTDAEERSLIIEQLEERGISLDQLRESVSQPEADPFDLLCFVAFNVPVRSRRERAQQLRADGGLLEHYSGEVREILSAILEKYVEHGDAQFKLPDILSVPPIDAYGNTQEIADKFGGAQRLREAVAELQAAIYAA